MLCAAVDALTWPGPCYRSVACLLADESIVGQQPGSHTELEQRRWHSINSNVQPDPRFATYPSTSPANDKNNSIVLLPGSAWSGGGRYILGPAGLTSSAISSAGIHQVSGQWIIQLDLTGEGSVRWDAMAQQQFHQIVGIDLNGEVISAPITQPTQSSFTPFNGRLQISGGFSKAQAKAIASELP